MAMRPHAGKFNFYHGLAVSLVLHAGIAAAPLLSGILHLPEREKRATLRIDLFGMMADRQQEEKRLRQAPSPAPSRREKEKPGPRQVRETYKTVETGSPVRVAKPQEKPAPVERETSPLPASAAPSPAVAGAEVQQRQQTLSDAELEAAQIRQYLAKLAKRLRSNLVYPEEVRKNGTEGVSTVAFHITKSGELVEHTLKVQKSSGYPALDASALKSVRVSAPFEKPPKELTVSIAMSFNVRN